MSFEEIKAILEFVLAKHFALAIPLLFLFIAFLAKAFPRKFWAFSDYGHKFKDFTHVDGPKLSDNDLDKFESLKNNRRRLVQAKLTTETYLATIYDQRSLCFNGFNRALLIAVAYPILLLMVTWQFTGGAIRVTSAELLPDADLHQKLMILLLPFISFFLLRYLTKLIRFVLLGCLNAYSASRWFKALNFSIEVGVAVTVAVAVAVAVIFAVAVNFAAADAVFAFAIAGVVVGVVVVFGAGAGAVLVAFAVAVAAAVLVAIAAAVDAEAIFAVAVARAGVGAVLVAIVVIYAVIFTVALAVALAVGVLYDYISGKGRLISQGLAMTLLWAITLFALLMPVWFASYIEPDSSAFAADNLSFVFVFFFAVLPLINALSDWLSVSFTQFCLSQYQAEKSSGLWWLWFFLDFGVALLMIVVVLLSVFAALSLAQAWGWQIDAKQMVEAFKTNTFAAENMWLVLLVLTNLLPTLLHFLLVCASLFCGWYFLPRTQVNDLLQKYQSSKQLDQQAKQNANTKTEFTWSETEASRVAQYIVGMPRIYAFCTLSLAVPFLYGVYKLLSEFLPHIVSWWL